MLFMVIVAAAPKVQELADSHDLDASALVESDRDGVTKASTDSPQSKVFTNEQQTAPPEYSLSDSRYDPRSAQSDSSTLALNLKLNLTLAVAVALTLGTTGAI